MVTQKYNIAGHIQIRSVSLKAKLIALAEQRGESLNDTIKAALEAGIVALTRDDGRLVQDSIRIACAQEILQ